MSSVTELLRRILAVAFLLVVMVFGVSLSVACAVVALLRSCSEWVYTGVWAITEQVLPTGWVQGPDQHEPPVFRAYINRYVSGAFYRLLKAAEEVNADDV